jgi:hypothetical protein
MRSVIYIAINSFKVTFERENLMYRVRSEYATTKIDGAEGRIDILIEVARISYPWIYEPIIIEVKKDGSA